MKFVSVQEMIAIEREADRSGLNYPTMMENAGSGLAQIVHDRYQYLKPGPVFGLIGSGNNGGDTLVALSNLAKWGWQPRAYLVRPRSMNDPLIQRLIDSGGQIYSGEDDQDFEILISLIQASALLLDGVLGTGIRLPLRGRVANILGLTALVIAQLEEKPTVVAVDCPSGVDCDSGEAADECIPADLTVTMAAVKMGLLKFPAYNFVGELQLVGIGLRDDLVSWNSINRFVADDQFTAQCLPNRGLDAHKGTFGTALIIAGSINYTGAVLLSGQAAYRVGAGLVTLAVPEPLHSALAGHFAEATWLPLPDESGVISEKAYDVLERNFGRQTAVLIGPGFGLNQTTGKFLSRMIGDNRLSRASDQSNHVDALLDKSGLSTLVLDADGLKLLAEISDWPQRLPPYSILTPHPGEMAVLTSLSVAEIQRDRLACAEHYAEQWGHVVILKGAFTIIASPEGKTAIIPVAAPALARAGTGDVLAGLVVGLRAQGVDAFAAAVSGAWIHARAGLHAAEVLGSSAVVLAGDVLQGIVDVMATLSDR